MIIDSYKKSISKGFNLDDPKTIEDKITWIKIFDCTDLKTKCADKIELHNYCINKLGVDLCVPIIKIYRDVNEINLDELPDSFVLKCNHGSGWNIVVKNKSNLNLSDAKSKLKRWLSLDYSNIGNELQYHNILPKCYVEKYIGNGIDDIKDYKFLCFNGEPKYCQIISDRNDKKLKRLNYYDMNFNFCNISQKHFHNNPSMKDTKPQNYDKMIKYAKILSNDFNFVRVDFYEVNGQIYLGELTFTPANGNFYHTDYDIDIELGSLLKL